MIEAFLSFLKHEKRSSQHTVSSYATDLDQFSKYLLFQYELAQPEQATGPMLRSWIVSLMEEGLNAASINRKIASLRSFFKFLRKRNAIQKDPSAILSAMKTRKKLPAFVEEKAMTALFDDEMFSDDFPGQRDRTVLELLYGTGIRLSELIGLEIRDVDVYAATIRVFGKRAKERIVPVPKPVMTVVSNYLNVREAEAGENALIVSDKGAAAYPVLIQRIVKKYLTAVTTLTQKSPHVLRHTYATHLLDHGADLNAIKELLGHANLGATQIYTHTSIEKLKKTHLQAHPKA